MSETVERVAAVWAALLLFHAAPAAALQHEVAPEATRPAAGPADPGVLEVPYLPQSEALCGGAAVAMVMRYWGARDIYAEEFAPYVSDDERGITTEALARAARRSGWTALPFSAASGDVAHQLSRSRPLVALIQVAPSRFHYVVIVGRTDDQVLYHDPAVAPYRKMSLERFERAWSESGRWAMLLLPKSTSMGRAAAPAVGAGERETATADPAELTRDHGAAGHDDASPCAGIVARAIERAASGELEEAERLLARADQTCPRSLAVTRELAGLRFRQGRVEDAVRLAERAVALDPEDDYAWQLLAAARFRAGDRASALAAWNRVGEPRVDLVDIQGLRRTRYRVVADRLGIAPRDTLTPEALRRAERRVAALPSVSASAVRYRPLLDGSVELEAAVVERPALPSGLPQLAGTAARALPSREIALSFASPTGAGALLTARWRWWGNRPLLGASVAAPGALGLPGVMELEGYWERQSYEAPATPDPDTDSDPIIVEAHRHAALRLGEWISGSLWLNGGLGIDRWDDRPARPAAHAAAQLRAAGDRLALLASASIWPSISGRAAFGTIDLGASWRSSGIRRPLEWRARAGLELTSDGSPLALWGGAGTGHARDALLRAHPVLKGGAVRGDRIGRSLAHGGVEVTRWLWDGGLGALGVALFIDGAKLWEPLDPGSERGPMVDAGTGVRFATPWQGRLRADFALGTRDGATAVSVAWEAPWPGALLIRLPS